MFHFNYKFPEVSNFLLLLVPKSPLSTWRLFCSLDLSVRSAQTFSIWDYSAAYVDALVT